MALTNKQQVFVNEYLKCWNSSEAARRAGYTGKANVVGPRLLANVSIKEEIEIRLTELKMSADEALVELTAMARSDIGDFIKTYEDINGFFLDLHGAREKGLLKLVKKLKYNAEGRPEIELYDKQAALVQIGKAHGLFVDRQEITGADGGPMEITGLDDIIKKVRGGLPK